VLVNLERTMKLMGTISSMQNHRRNRVDGDNSAKTTKTMETLMEVKPMETIKTTKTKDDGQRRTDDKDNELTS
jgi:hypothetical protein